MVPPLGIFGRGRSGGGGFYVRPSTWVIAASDSRNKNADFVCPGTADDVAIANFLGFTSNVSVTFLEGHYAMDGGQALDFSQALVRGQGYGFTIFDTHGHDQVVFGMQNSELVDLQVIGASTAAGSVAPVQSSGISRFDRLRVANSANGAAYRPNNGDIWTACVANCPTGTGFEAGNSSTFIGCEVPAALVGFDALENSRLIGCTLGRYSRALAVGVIQLGTAFTGVGHNLLTGCEVDAVDLDDAGSANCDYLANLLATQDGTNWTINGSTNRFGGNVLGTFTDAGAGNVFSFTGGASGDNF